VYTQYADSDSDVKTIVGAFVATSMGFLGASDQKLRLE
jgi:hypothetical protein